LIGGTSLAFSHTAPYTLANTSDNGDSGGEFGVGSQIVGIGPGDIAGVSVTRQGIRDQASLHIDSRTDPWGTPYFWFGFERRRSTLVEGTDLAAMAAKKISVTPLSVDMTDTTAVAALTEYLKTVG
jgi:hypothetical protein